MEQTDPGGYPLVDFLSDKLLPFFSVLGPHRLIQAAVIVLLSWILSRIVDRVLSRVIGRWTSRTKNTFDDSLIEILHRPLRLSIILIGLGVGTLWLKMPATPTFATLAILKTIAIIVWLQFFMQFARMLIGYLSNQEHSFNIVQPRTRPLLINLAVIASVAIGIYMVMLAWNINISAWLASAGIVGLALSFAAKDTLANLFAGMSILVDAPYKIGDFIVLDSGERGEVTHIGMRSTRLLTRDDVEVTIPNGVMGNSKIFNESGGPHEKHRIRVAVSAAYGCDIDLVRKVLMDIALDCSDLCRKPEARVRFRRFGPSGLEFELLGWVEQPVLRGRILDALHQQIYKEFNKHQIEIPFAKQDIYIKEFPGRKPD